jgi:hypothetical protein
MASTLDDLMGDWNYGRIFNYMTEIERHFKRHNFRIREDDDSLVWSLNPTRNYVPRVGYTIIIVEEGKGEQHV